MVSATAGARSRQTELRASPPLLVGALGVGVALLAAAQWTTYVILGRTLNLFESGTAIVGGQRLLDGQMPYTDFFAFYGPLTYLLPGIADEVTGSVTSADFGFGLVVGIVSAVVCYLLTVGLTDRPVAALIAPVVIVLLGANTARSLPALASILLLVWFERSGRRGWAIGAGACAGIGLLWIQDAGAWMCVSVALVVLAGIFAARVRTVLDWRAFLLYAAGVVVAITPWVIWTAVRSAFGAWIYWTVIFPSTTYTERDPTAYFLSLVDTALTAPLAYSIYVFTFFVVPFVAIALIAVGNLVFAAVSLRKRAEPGSGAAAPVTTLVLAVYALLQLRVLAASIDEAKLIDNAAPTIVCAVALILITLRRSGSARRSLLALRIIAVVVLAWLIVWPLWSAARTAGLNLGGEPAAVASEIGGLPFVAAGPPSSTPDDLDELIVRINELADPGGGILVLPTSPLVYAMADRANATRYEYLDPVYTNAQVDAELAARVTSGEIALVILGDNAFPGSELTGEQIAPETYAAITDRFTVADVVGGFTILVPRD